MQGYKNILKSEIKEFRKAGHLFLNGELTKNEFKGKSGGMGVYAQQDQKTFMIRLKTPSGIITKSHLELILQYAKTYGLRKVHLTTRQAVQLHDLEIDQVCDIMEDAIEHDLFTRGGGGNFPRNVSLSPLSGVEQGEIFDVTPYAMQVGAYFLTNATGYKLPRKLKAAFSNTEMDTACASINDVGFMAALEAGKPMFKMWLAGGLGNGPKASIPYPHLVKPEEVLYYIEAMVQLFIAEGDYENKAKARTRFIPVRMGEEAFLACYNQHLEEVKSQYTFEGIVPVMSVTTAQDNTRTSVLIAQRQEQMYTVILHPLCGQLSTEDLEYIVQFTKPIQQSQIRISMEEDMYIRNLPRDKAEELLGWAKDKMMDTPIRMSVSCVGTPSCQMGILQSQELCKRIIGAVEAAGLTHGKLPLIQISGCLNSCGRHQVAAIGFAGRKIKVDDSMEEGFDLYVLGRTCGNGAVLGELKGRMLSKVIPDFIVAIGHALEEKNEVTESYLASERFQAMVKQYCI